MRYRAYIDLYSYFKGDNTSSKYTLTSANDIGSVFAAARANFDPPPIYEVAAGFVHLDDLTKEHINEHFVPAL